jgi:hypothetical protein
MANSNIGHCTSQAAPTFKEAGNFIARVRRKVRDTMAVIERGVDEAWRVRAEVQMLKDHSNPFDAERIRKLEQRADELDAQSGALREAMRRYGYLLVDAAPQIDATTTLAERCDLLNVNVADRIGLSEDDGVVTILFAHALEDSAERRRCEFKDGPLFHALLRVMMDFLDTPQGQAAGNTLFEPGGMFEWLPWYRVSSDGSMTHMRPPLREARPSDADTIGEGDPS